MIKRLSIFLIILIAFTSCKKAPNYSRATYEATIFRLKHENDSLKEQLEKCTDWIELLESKEDSKQMTSKDSLASKIRKEKFIERTHQLLKFKENKNTQEKQGVYRLLDSLIENGELKKRRYYC